MSHLRRPVLLRPKQMADVLGELLLQSLRLGDVIGKLLAHAIDGIFKLSPAASSWGSKPREAAATAGASLQERGRDRDEKEERREKREKRRE